MQIEDERIEVVSSWPEPKSIREIQVSLQIANFYQRFMQNFCKIAGLITSMLKIT